MNKDHVNFLLFAASFFPHPWIEALTFYCSQKGSQNGRLRLENRKHNVLHINKQKKNPHICPHQQLLLGRDERNGLTIAAECDWTSWRITCDYSPFGLFLQQQYQILQDKKPSGAADRERKAEKGEKKWKGKNFSLIFATHKPKHTQRHTHWGSQWDNWGIVGSRHVTGCVYKCVSQSLFLDEHINSRPSLPRHRHAAHSCLWQSHPSHLLFLKLSQVYVNVSRHMSSFPCLSLTLPSSLFQSLFLSLSSLSCSVSQVFFKTYQPHLVVNTDPMAKQQQQQIRNLIPLPVHVYLLTNVTRVSF